MPSFDGHDYLKTQLAKRGVVFEALGNGILRCDDHEVMSASACIDALLRKSLAGLPHLFTAQDRRVWNTMLEEDRGAGPVVGCQLRCGIGDGWVGLSGSRRRRTGLSAATASWDDDLCGSTQACREVDLIRRMLARRSHAEVFNRQLGQRVKCTTRYRSGQKAGAVNAAARHGSINEIRPVPLISKFLT